jgi:lysophospholipase L1-like esterase
MNRRRFLGCTLASAALTSSRSLLTSALAADRADAASAPFFFQDGDRVVMIGDSITEQHLHSNYVESFTLSRFPRWTLAFRNAGIGGDTSQGGANRTGRDILSFNPTALTVEFGMNDAGYQPAADPARLERYTSGLQRILDQVMPKRVRVAVLSSSPVEKKEDGRAIDGYNQTLETFEIQAGLVAARNRARFVDQLHPHLAVLQKARDADPANRINGGDAVHPGPPGQLLMAWAILKGLHGPRVVSEVEIDADRARVTRREGCLVTGVRKSRGGIRFTRADDALPWWIPEDARSILKWAPQIVDDLNRYTVKIAGLPEGAYDLRIDGEKVASVTAGELAAGYNMALLTAGPIAKQSRAVNDAVFFKNRYYHDQIFRGVTLNGKVPDADKPAMIAERMNGMPPLEQAIKDALVLRPHQFELTRA